MGHISYGPTMKNVEGEEISRLCRKHQIKIYHCLLSQLSSC